MEEIKEEVHATEVVEIKLYGAAAKLIKLMSLVEDWDMDDIVGELVDVDVLKKMSNRFKEAWEEVM